MRATTLAIVLCSLGVAGCGSSASEDSSGSEVSSGSDAAQTSCIQLVNGNTLCGEEATSYCQNFIARSPDDFDGQSIDACRAAGTDIGQTKSERAEEQRATEAADQQAQAKAYSGERRGVDAYKAIVDREVGPNRIHDLALIGLDGSGPPAAGEPPTEIQLMLSKRLSKSSAMSLCTQLIEVAGGKSPVGARSTVSSSVSAYVPGADDILLAEC